jgi:S1-C subfamily serine protease
VPAARVVEFRDKDSGQVIRISTDATGKPLVDDKGMASLETEGTGPPLQLDVFSTRFLVARDGRLLTNHHVAEPWWGDEELKQLLDKGAVAFASSYTAYFPTSSQGISAKVERISAQADLATLRLQSPAPPHAALLELDDRSEASVTGDPAVLIGYPTGIEGIERLLTKGRKLDPAFFFLWAALSPKNSADNFLRAPQRARGSGPKAVSSNLTPATN